MASELRVNTLKDASGINSVATSVVFGGTAKAWVHYTTVTSTAVRDSYNVTGLTDEGTGKTTVTIANDMVNNDYSATMFTSANTGSGAEGEFGNAYAGGLGVRATGSLMHESYGSSFIDSALCDVTIHGDLA